MSIVKEFQEFAFKGNVVDLAVGVIMGAAFGPIVSTLVEKVIMPPIGMATGGLDFSQYKFVLRPANEALKQPEIAVGWGALVTVVISFFITAFVIFLLIKAMNEAKRRMVREAEAHPPPPPAPTKEEMLLTEIRDLLAKR